MAKSKSHYICSACGTVANKWAGQCEGCGEWDTLSEEVVQAIPKGLNTGGKANSLEWSKLNTDGEATPRTLTNMAELDRVLGGGLVAGSAILIGGDPGIGKSTLLLQLSTALAKRSTKVAYISGEESEAQIGLRASRLGVACDDVLVTAATSVRDIIAALDAMPDVGLVIIDSIQTMYIDNIESAPGTVSQVRASSNELIRQAKKRGFMLMIVGHVTKDGQIAGPRVLEHMVDTVLYFEGERGHSYRILRSVKNRFGGTDEIGVFEMTDKGLAEVANPSAVFLTDREHPVSGTAIFAGMEGTRPILVEIQALVSPSYMSTPRRAVVGWDNNRLAMLLAVLETRCGLKFSDKEVYLNVAGGFRVQEPAADLAVAGALISALANEPLSSDTIIFGEVGLSSEVRQVARYDARLKEASKLGFAKAICPSLKSTKSLTIETKQLQTLRELVELLVSDAATTQAA